MKKIIFYALLIILIPILIIGLDKKDILIKIKYGIYNNKKIKVKRLSKNKIDDIMLEDYVFGVVAGEMPASFNIEALKAQAVASRTYALNKIEHNKNVDYDVVDSTSNQVYLDDEDIKNKWQNNYDKNVKKVKEAVDLTKGEVILYDNKIINAMFFSTSNGFTENSEDVFSVNEPYLKSVISNWDEVESPSYISTKTVPISEFVFNLNLDSKQINISNVEKTNTGRVKNITINNKVFKADKIRQAFSLKSTCFDINIKNDYVIFNVKGFGHGVGMSQYGANGMAKENKTYDQILKHYYKNCEIKKIF